DQNYREKPVPLHLRGGYQDFWIASDVLEFTSHSYDGHMFDADGKRREMPPGRYRADFVTDCAMEFIERPQERPFFLFVSYIEPHHQNDHRRFEGPHGSKERFADYEAPGDLVGLAGDWRENYSDYLGCCWSLDQQVGRYREALEKRGLWENTLVIYTSDHGCHFRTRNGEYKRSCHDACLRIPLIIRGPGFCGDRVREELVSLIDLTPTVLAAAGISAPPYMAGQALQPLAADEKTPWRDAIYAEISEDHIGRAVRTRQWKYAVRAPGQDLGWKQPTSDVYVEAYLYDLESDPHERRNLIAEPALAEVRAALREKLIAFMLAAGEKRPEIKPAI
ncbi:MAG: sulfatase-like hydrolase/transferase, partial [Planctomycetota bacterium]|nr:sulfatase-like hydrolase/transferase [Planctomycetota bacterium]